MYYFVEKNKGDFMKRFIAAVSAAVLIFYCSVTVFSFEIDGIDNGTEWRGTQSAVLVDGESNCKVKFGMVKWSADNEANVLYLCFNFIESEPTEENINSGVSLSVENSEPFVVTASTSPNAIDNDKYSFSGAVSANKNEDITCEIKLGMKYGIPSKVDCKVRFIDSDAKISNVYDLTIETVEETETTVSTTEKEKTTKTTSPKTTKKNSEDLFDIINTKTTTAKPKKTTTVKPEKTSKTSTKTTKAKTTKAKTTKKRVPSSSKTDTQIIYEEKTQNITEISTYVIESEIAETETHSNVISTTEGKKYKLITAIAGGSILLLVAVLGSMKISKKSTDEENDPKS